jgi:hypothetical protein
MTSIADTYRLLRAAGFTADKAAVMVAIGLGESGLRPDAVGDKSLVDGTWGPSVGLFQVRTLKAETGTGGTRDIKKLQSDPAAQARAAFAISDGGRKFTPWSVFTSGAYLKHLDRVRRELAGVADLDAPAPAGGTAGAVGVGLPNPLGALGKLLGIDDAAEGIAGSVAKGGAKLVIMGAALTAGVVLVVIGLYRGVAQQRVAEVKSEVRGAAVAYATKGGSAAAS